MKKIFTHCIGLALCLGMVTAQTQKRLYVLAEGTFSTKGEVGYVSLPDGGYHRLTEIDNYGNDLIRHDGKLYATGGIGFGSTLPGHVFIIDEMTGQTLDTLKNLGARQLAVYGNWLLVAGYNANRLVALDMTNDYSQVWALGRDKLMPEAEDVLVVGHYAYVSLPGATGGADSLAIVDLNTQDTLKTLRTVTNPQAVVLTDNGKLYVQSLDYSGLGMIVTQLDTMTKTVTRRDTTGLLCYGGFQALGNHLWFTVIENFKGRYIGRFRPLEPGNFQVDTVFYPEYRPEPMQHFNLYSFVNEPGKGVFLGSTAYSGSDTLFCWNWTDQVFDGPTSVRRMLYAEVTLTGRAHTVTEGTLTLWPNPTASYLNVDLKAGTALSLTDLQGREVLTGTAPQLDVRSLPAGIYLLRAEGYRPMRVLKQ